MNLLSLFKDLSLHPKNAQELKGLILQLAIQGKLTAKWREENPDVESVSVLFQNIEKERNRLIKEKKVKKSKQLAKVEEEEEYFEIPKSWKWERIGNIGNVFNGDSVNKSVKETKYTGLDSGFPYIATKDVGYGFDMIDQDNGVRIPFHESKFKVARKGTVLICSEGGSAGKKMGVITEDCCFGNKLYAIEQYGGIHSLYVLSLYGSMSFSSAFKESMSGIIGGISRSNFINLPIPIPPLQEQAAIVEIVNQLFAEVEQLEELTKRRIELKEDFVTSSLARLTDADDTEKEWELLKPHFKEFFTEKSSVKKLRASILQLAVQGKLTAKWRDANPDIEPASELLKRIKAEKEKLIKEKKIKKEKPLPAIEDKEKPFVLPVGWEWCRLQEVGLLERGKSKHRPRNDRRLFQNGLYPLVQTGDVSAAKNTGGRITTNRGYYNEFGLAQSRMWTRGTLCITIAANIAETGFLSFDACFPDSVVGFTEIVKSGKKLSNYVDYFITITKSDLERFAPSTAQKNINLGILNELKFPLPPIEEQQVIVEKVNSLMSLCDELEKQIENSQIQIEQLMQSCLREVV